MAGRTRITKLVSFPRSGLTFSIGQIEKKTPQLNYCEGYQCKNGLGEDIDCEFRGIRPPKSCPRGRIVKDHDNLLVVRRVDTSVLVLTRRDSSLAFSSFILWKLRRARLPHDAHLQMIAALCFTPYLVGFYRKWSDGSTREDQVQFFYEDLPKTLPDIAETLLGRKLKTEEVRRLLEADFKPKRHSPLAVLSRPVVVRQRQFWENRSFIAIWVANWLGRGTWALVKRLL